MKIMKEILLEIANENNVTNLDSIKLRLNNLETDRDSIESIVDNNTNGLINVGITERKLNLKGTELEFNGNKVDLDNIVYSNDLTNEINLLKQDVNKYIDEDELKLKTDILEQGISNSVSKSDFDTKVVDKITERLTIVEPKWKQEVTSSITSNLETVIDTKNQETLDLVNQGLNFTVNTIHTIENSTDVYELDINGLKGTRNLTGLELFEGMTFNIKITEANSTNVVMLRISGDKYNLTKEDGETVINLTVGELQKNRYYKVIFDGVRFVIPLEMVEYNQFLGTNFGGLLGTVGTKKVEVAYYDKANKQMVVPTVENSLTYFESSKFIPISGYQTAKKLENLFKIEILSMTNLLGVGPDVTEWYANLPSHIKKEKVISITNLNQGFWMEYCNLDLAANCVRVGVRGNGSNVPVNDIKVLVAYFT